VAVVVVLSASVRLCGSKSLLQHQVLVVVVACRKPPRNAQ
jgi:hypothetical protein